MGNVLTILGRASISLQMSLSRVETGRSFPLTTAAQSTETFTEQNSPEGQIGLQQQVEINPRQTKVHDVFPQIHYPLFKKPGGSRFVEGNQTDRNQAGIRKMDGKQSDFQGQRQARLVRNKQDR